MDEVFEVATPGKLNYPLLNTDEELFIVIEIKGCAVELYSGCLYSLRSVPCAAIAIDIGSPCISARLSHDYHTR